MTEPVHDDKVPAPEDLLARIDALRERIKQYSGDRALLPPHETLRDLIDEGRRE